MCDCIPTINERLAAHNTRVTLPMFGLQRPFVLTEKLNEKKRGKPVMLFASFCAMCGEKYAPDPDESAS